jgi:NADH-quinone oxidoreductase subunit J
MTLFLLLAVLILAITSLHHPRTVPAMLSFAMMMFLLGIYYLLLDEKLLGLLQIFVYTGGIVVLMLFGVSVIGDAFPETESPVRPWAVAASVITALFLSLYVLWFLPNKPTEQIMGNQAQVFTEHYADLVLILAMIGVSLLYGTLAMMRYLGEWREEVSS